VKSTTVQIKLLDCMLSVIRDYILEEVKNADFIAIQADDTTYISTHCQLVLALHRRQQLRTRAVFRVQPLTPSLGAYGEAVSIIVPNEQKNKFIAEAYDAAAVRRGATSGVQRKILYVYDHCYHNSHISELYQ